MHSTEKCPPGGTLRPQPIYQVSLHHGVPKLLGAIIYISTALASWIAVPHKILQRINQKGTHAQDALYRPGFTRMVSFHILGDAKIDFEDYLCPAEPLCLPFGKPRGQNLRILVLSSRRPMKLSPPAQHNRTPQKHIQTGSNIASLNSSRLSDWDRTCLAGCQILAPESVGPQIHPPLVRAESLRK